MKHLIITLITFYQRFISPYKGFKCAHNALHKQGTCSHSIKQLIDQYGFINALPKVRARFSECSYAYKQLKANTLPVSVDLPCDVGIGECIQPDSSIGSAACDCFGPCDFLPDWKELSKKTRKRIVVVLVIGVLILSYVFYGRGIESIYIVDKGEQNQSLLARLTQRAEPEVRLLLIVNGEKIYSDILLIKQENTEYKFTLERSFLQSSFERLEILDARLNVADKLMVVGQVLDKFDSPELKGQSVRFEYRMKRRWHFF